MVDLRWRHEVTAASVEPEVLRVLREGRWVGGPVVQRAEAAVAELFGRAHAVGVGSGTDAIALSLAALGVQPGDVVAVPALTFFATAGAVCALGAIPRVVDVDERGLLREDLVAEQSGLKAVLPVHLFGNRCSAEFPGLIMVDDAAQATGSGHATGTLTAISTYPTKIWSGLGDGGFVVGDNLEQLQKVRKLGSHGMVEPHLHHTISGHVGRNSRLDTVSAAVLLGQLPTLSDRIARRQQIANYFDDQLPTELRPIPRDANNPVPVYCTRTTVRAELQSHLKAQGIDSTVYYPRPLHHQPALAAFSTGVRAPVAERLCKELLALPMHAGLSDAQVEAITSATQAFFR